VNILTKQIGNKYLSNTGEEEIADWGSLNGICWAASISGDGHHVEISYRDHSLVSGDEALLWFVFEDAKLAVHKSKAALVDAARRWLLRSRSIFSTWRPTSRERARDVIALTQ
jgi:hypothetical protein